MKRLKQQLNQKSRPIQIKYWQFMVVMYLMACGVLAILYWIVMVFQGPEGK